jgi:hypothetical protein
MTQALITTAPQDSAEQLLSHDDAYLLQVDHDALAHALKTVNWHPKDVSQFLRSAANR